MTVNTSSLNFLRNETKLEIPFFQRPYVWKYENVSLLFNDLKNNPGNHFLGSILLKNEANISENVNETTRKDVIIDGQQRLTTLSILVKVMFDYLRETDSFSENDDFVFGKRALFYNDDRGWIPHIESSYHDRDNFLNIMGSVQSKSLKRVGIVDYYESPEEESVKQELANEQNITEDLYEKRYNDSDNLLRQCYKYFYKNIHEMKPQEVKSLWDKLFADNTNLLVVIRLDSNDKEQEIFDTINSAGVHLSCTDIIKNHIFEKYASTGVDKKKVLEFYKNTWQETFEADDFYPFWNKEKNVGRNLRTNLELFFQAYAIIYETKEKIYDVENDTLANLANNFKRHLNKLKTKDEVESFIIDIIETAKIYYQLPQFSITDYITFNDIEKRVACIMAVSNNTTFTPYLLYLYKNYGEQTDILHSKLQYIDNVLMHYIISGNSNKNFNKYCTDLIDDDKNGGKSESHELNNITLVQLQSGLKSKKNNTLAKLILYFIELYRNNKKGADSNFKGYQFTDKMELEHILPKKWEQYWSPEKTQFVTDDGQDIDDFEKGKKNRYDKLYSLGNMTILSKDLNNRIKNKDFKTKVEGDNGKNGEGIRLLSEFKITTEILPPVNSPDSLYIWNEQKIVERENRFLKEILEIWPLENTEE